MRGSMAANIPSAIEFSMKKAGITELKDKQRECIIIPRPRTACERDTVVVVLVSVCV